MIHPEQRIKIFYVANKYAKEGYPNSSIRRFYIEEIMKRITREKWICKEDAVKLAYKIAWRVSSNPHTTLKHLDFFDKHYFQFGVWRGVCCKEFIKNILKERGVNQYEIGHFLRKFSLKVKRKQANAVFVQLEILKEMCK